MKHCNFCTIVLAPTRRQGLSRCRGGSFERIPISKKNFEVLSSQGTYHVTREDAQGMVARGDAKWNGPKHIIRNPDISKRCIWTVKGPAAFYSEGVAFGPKNCSLQLT